MIRQDSPLKQRNEWKSWLVERITEHQHLTAEIVRLEIELNKRVYGLSDLPPDKIRIVEETTEIEEGEV